MLKEGDAAPDFVLPDADGKDFRLSTLRGTWIVLYFYPKDRTPGCTLEAKGFRDLETEWAACKARVVGVSLDSTDSHCDFRDRHAISFPLLSDRDGRIHDLYGAWRTRLLGRNAWGVKRCTYLIDPLGIVRKAYPFVQPVGHPKSVLADLKELQGAS